MSSFSSAHKTNHVSPLSREQACDSVELSMSQGGCMTNNLGQMLGTELGLIGMTAVEYTNPQHLIQAHMGSPDGPDARSHLTGSAVISPLTTSQAIDLSTSNDDHCLVMVGEKTPAPYGEVPGFVLARIRGQESLTERSANSSTSSQDRSRSSARVCLETRFNTMSPATTRQQDIQSAVLSNCLTILQQSTEAQEAVIHLQKQKSMKTDRASPIQSQIFAHMVEPNKHQGLIGAKSVLFSFHGESDVTKAYHTTGSNTAEEQQLVNIQKDMATPAASRNHCSAHYSQPTKAAKVAPDSAGETRSNAKKRPRACMPLPQRREKHNSKERERRKRIRLCCDELNTMVPFCHSNTDKVTTLQWTTTFLRYINKIYGDTFKEEFEKVFAQEKGLFHKSSCSLDQVPMHQHMNETLGIDLSAEQ